MVHSTRPAPSCARTPRGRTALGCAAAPSRPAQPPAPAVGPTDVAAAVDDVKRLLGEGRITQAVDTLGAILPAAAAQHGEHSPVVRTLRKQYAATLMDDGQYRRALPELRRLADERAAEAGRADPQSLRFRYEAAQCLEQLGETGDRRWPSTARCCRTTRTSTWPVTRNSPSKSGAAWAICCSPSATAAPPTTPWPACCTTWSACAAPAIPIAAEIRRTLQWLGQMLA